MKTHIFRNLNARVVRIAALLLLERSVHISGRMARLVLLSAVSFHATGTAQWVPIQTPIIPGNVNFLSIDAKDDTIVGGSYQSGGVFISLDAGGSWNEALPVEGYFDAVKIGDGIIYAGNTWGVYRTTDYGDTWSKDETGLPYRPNVYAMDILDSFVFAGTLRGVFRSSDRGASWTPTSYGLPTWAGGEPRGIVSLDVQDSVIYAGSEAFGVYRSSDDGEEWIAANSFMVARASDILHDGGLTYSASYTGVYTSWNPIAGWWHRFSADAWSLAKFGDKVWVGTQGDGIYSSTDDGFTWLAETDPPGESYVFGFAATDSLLFAANLSGIFSRQGGDTGWSPSLTSYPRGMTVEHLGSDGVSLIAAGNGEACVSTDTGNSWTRIDADGYTFEEFAHNDSFFFASAGNSILRSSDHGVTWENPAPDVQVGSINSIIIRDATVYLGAGWQHPVYGDEYGGLYRSSDHGVTWALAGFPDTAVYAVATAGDRMFVGTGHGVYRSLEGDTLWSKTGVGLPAGEPVTVLLPGASQLFAATLSAVYLTTDQGDTWTDISIPGLGGGGNWVSTMIVYNGNTYAATYEGAYLLTGCGPHWVPFNEGFGGPGIGIPAMVAHQGYLVAGTNAGVYRRAIGDLPQGMEFHANTGWNIVSPPLDISDNRVDSYFPCAVSDIFGYDHGYVPENTLAEGRGYWVKFQDDISFHFQGTPVSVDTIDIVSSWNMIGSISVPVPVSGIGSIPPGIEVTPFFSYSADSGYSPADTIHPGRGYWVKSGVGGSLILSSPGPGAAPSSRIRIVASDDHPPEPPTGEETAGRQMMPQAFLLLQNYPNPFNPSTSIDYQLPEGAHVSLKLFSILGEEVRTLADKYQGPGYKSVRFDAAGLPSGVFIYRLQAGNYTATRKLVLIR